MQIAGIRWNADVQEKRILWRRNRAHLAGFRECSISTSSEPSGVTAFKQESRENNKEISPSYFSIQKSACKLASL